MPAWVVMNQNRRVPLILVKVTVKDNSLFGRQGYRFGIAANLHNRLDPRPSTLYNTKSDYQFFVRQALEIVGDAPQKRLTVDPIIHAAHQPVAVWLQLG